MSNTEPKTLKEYGKSAVDTVSNWISHHAMSVTYKGRIGIGMCLATYTDTFALRINPYDLDSVESTSIDRKGLEDAEVCGQQLLLKDTSGRELALSFYSGTFLCLDAQLRQISKEDTVV